MDINNYSYTPNMLKEDEHFLYYENDDMYIEVDKGKAYGKYIYWIYACSYDGQLEVCEKTVSKTVAAKIFDHIVQFYADTPPDTNELNREMEQIKQEFERR